MSIGPLHKMSHKELLCVHKERTHLDASCDFTSLFILHAQSERSAALTEPGGERSSSLCPELCCEHTTIVNDSFCQSTLQD